jgi:hypothetical protein
MEALVEGAAAELSAAPHSPQNLADGTFSKLQLAQGRFNAVPHSLQNFSPSGFSALQLAHRIGPPFARLQLSGRQIVRGCRTICINSRTSIRRSLRSQLHDRLDRALIPSSGGPYIDDVLFYNHESLPTVAASHGQAA